jgi:hypothetical protein
VRAPPYFSFVIYWDKTHRKVHDSDPTKFPSKIKWLYSSKTSTTSLRPHIERYHLDIYSTLAKERGWRVLLPGLVSQAQSESAAAAQEAMVHHDKFDEHTFHQYLLQFIISDDQVSLQFLFAPKS